VTRRKSLTRFHLWSKLLATYTTYIAAVGCCVADELVGERDKFRLVTVELDSTFTELTGF